MTSFSMEHFLFLLWCILSHQLSHKSPFANTHIWLNHTKLLNYIFTDMRILFVFSSWHFLSRHPLPPPIFLTPGRLAKLGKSLCLISQLAYTRKKIRTELETWYRPTDLTLWTAHGRLTTDWLNADGHTIRGPLRLRPSAAEIHANANRKPPRRCLLLSSVGLFGLAFAECVECLSVWLSSALLCWMSFHAVMQAETPCCERESARYSEHRTEHRTPYNCDARCDIMKQRELPEESMVHYRVCRSSDNNRADTKVEETEETQRPCTR